VMGCCQFLYFVELINNSNFFVDQFAFVTGLDPLPTPFPDSFAWLDVLPNL